SCKRSVATTRSTVALWRRSWIAYAGSANAEARAGVDRGPPRDGDPAGGRGVHHRVERVSVDLSAKNASVRRRRSRRRHPQYRNLASVRRRPECEIGDIETPFVEDRTRGEVERIVAGVVAVARDERAARRQDLDLIRLVRADVKVSLDVELGPIRTVQRTGSERRAVSEDRDRSSAAVFVDGDPQNAVVSGVGDVKETLRAIESNPVRAEGRVAVRLEEHVGLPERLSAAARADRVDRARERVR